MKACVREIILILGDTMQDHADYVITLVHGTYARNAKWTKASSKLRAHLQKHLDGEPIFSEFQWDGRNRHSSRKRAALRVTKTH